MLLCPVRAAPEGFSTWDRLELGPSRTLATHAGLTSWKAGEAVYHTPLMPTRRYRHDVVPNQSNFDFAALGILV